MAKTPPSPPTALDLATKLATFSEPWQPRVVGRFNGHDLMVAKLKGEFTWRIGCRWWSISCSARRGRSRSG